MANTLTFFTRELARAILDRFESKRTLSKSVNTQMLDGKFDPFSGENVDFRRPIDHLSTRSSDGDISGGTPSDLITGKATGTVQDYITVRVDFNEADQALRMGNISQYLDPAATRIKTDLEVDFAKFMQRNSALSVGDPDVPVDTWLKVANAGALMRSIGVPENDMWNYVVNPFTEAKLADVQRTLGAADDLVKSAFEKGMIRRNFAGLNVMTGTTLPTYTTAVGADRAGTLTAPPDPTYLSAKDTMTQTLAVTGFQANLEVKEGQILEVSGRFRLNIDTKDPILDDTGAKIRWRANVVSDVTLGASGEGNIVVTGPAIFEATGAYNTVDSALTTSDVVTFIDNASTTYQPNLFYHKNAFSIGSVPMEKLFSTDTIGQTEDGLQIRVSKFADGLANKQIVRFDLRPAFAALNPFFAGQGHG